MQKNDLNVSNEDNKENALLVARINGADDERSFLELSELASSAGAFVVDKITQSGKADKGWFFGKGKLEEIKTFVQEYNITTVICDNELSGTQAKNMSEFLNANVIDRSELILDIFAKRASSTEGKLQVELAQLKYSLPRLIGKQGRMNKYGGGIGMRGPGEKKLETDRRLIRQKVTELEQKLKQMTSQRDLRRKKRETNNEKTVALAGYTNAGKSTVMNVLSKSGDTPMDMLFATLDPKTSKVFVETGKQYLLTDTVGFVERLPHEFINAFSSTLEEARIADVVLHIVDASDKNIDAKYDTVLKVLDGLGVDENKIITVYNKIDLIVDEFFMPTNKNYVQISAKKKTGIDELKLLLKQKLFD